MNHDDWWKIIEKQNTRSRDLHTYCVCGWYLRKLVQNSVQSLLSYTRLKLAGENEFMATSEQATVQQTTQTVNICHFKFAGLSMTSNRPCDPHLNHKVLVFIKYTYRCWRKSPAIIHTTDIKWLNDFSYESGMSSFHVLEWAHSMSWNISHRHKLLLWYNLSFGCQKLIHHFCLLTVTLQTFNKKIF